MPFIVVSEDNWFAPLRSRIIIYITTRAFRHGDLRLAGILLNLHWTEYIFAPMDTRNVLPHLANRLSPKQANDSGRLPKEGQ